MSESGPGQETHRAAAGAPAAGPETVTALEPSLWQTLSRAHGVEETAQAWTPLMFSMLGEALICSVFVADQPGRRLRAVSNWPRARLPRGALIAAAETAMREGRGVVRGTMSEGGGDVAVAVPLVIGTETCGAVGFEAGALTRDALQASMRKLQWGAAWIRDVLRAEQSAAKDIRYAHAVNALHVVTKVAEQEGFEKAARACVTDLATRFRCDRVSVGFRGLRACRVRAISHSAQFGRQMTLVRMLGAAMDEAIDQRGVVIWPVGAAAEPMATHCHEKLARAHGIGTILTVPLYAVDRFVGALVFERPAEDPFLEGDAEILEAVATVVAPVLDEVRRGDRWLIVKAGEAINRQFAAIFGPGQLARKAIVLSLLAGTVFFSYARAPDRVSANARVEGAVQRAITAPFDGFIAASEVRAGDRVAAGDVLVRLDDRELTLERLRLESKLQLDQIEYQQALAGTDRAEVSIRRNQIEQTDAQIGLVNKQLERTTLRAPFDGVVASGDLSQSIGAAVTRGETLMTVVPRDDYRVVLNVDERRISDIAAGQQATLVVTALPGAGFGLKVTRITPVADYGEGKTTFRVNATLDAAASALQPGMEGIAKIDVGERRLIGLWMQPILDWGRLKLWDWFGYRPGQP